MQAHDHFGARGANYAPLIGLGSVDLRGLLIAVVCALASFVLASLSLSLARFGDGALATVWLPAACAAAFLLRLPLKNEAPYLIGMFLGIYAADLAAGFSHAASIIFGIANVIEVTLIVALTRRFCGLRPAMTNLRHLGLVLWSGAIIAPFASTLTASIAMTTSLGLNGLALRNQVINWQLAHTLGVVLVVPTILLLADLWRERRAVNTQSLIEGGAVISLALGCSYLILSQTSYSLLFLIIPLTLLHAFKLGALGTTIFLGSLSVLAALLTSMGLGLIYEASVSPGIRNHVLQAFIAANFLTGLPVAAALASRERITNALEKRNEQLDILTDNISDAVLHYDLRGICTYASPSVHGVLGQEPERFIGTYFSNSMHEDARAQIAAAEQQLLSGASQTERFTYRRFIDSDEGAPVFIEAECAIVCDETDGTRKGIVVAARDVTERVELELLLTRARRHAENAANVKSEFLANMSHEIRTPMNGVLGFAELLLQSDLDPDQKRQADLIVQSGRSMMMLLNDVLDLSRIEAGHIAIDNAPVDLEATIAECAALHQPSAAEKGLKLTFGRPNLAEVLEGCRGLDMPDSGIPWIVTDALRLRQIILNLIGNAVKFTDSGEVTINYRPKGDEFAISVIDTGIGISEDQREHIFRPFTQVTGEGARRFGGTGLGLSISRQLADLLGGRIDVTSEEGVGSCFTLVLPALYAAPDAQPAFEPEPIALSDLPDQARILLAEDHDVNRMLAREMLERCGQSVAVAHDGNEAIAMVMDSVVRGSMFDLVLMDLQMPDCDGYEATRTIREEGIGPDQLPIVALTANAFPEDVVAVRKAGMQAHLAKPMIFADLARVLQRWLPTRIIERDSENQEVPADDVMPSLDDDRLDPGMAEMAAQFDTVRSDPQRNESLNPDPVSNHSPELIKRWNARREEAVEAVRSALANDLFNGDPDDAASRAELAKLVHKLAGTAAMFGEPSLGDQAAAFENALRLGLAPKVQKALANELLMRAGAVEDDVQ